MDTIVAPATPVGRAALAVIRVSGSSAHSICADCLASKTPISSVQRRFVSLYRFQDPIAGEVVDEVTAVRFDAPRSFTGEDMVEITCHGGPAVVERVVSTLRARGARIAQRGEFSRRAVLNGKMDVPKAEAVREIIESGTDAARQSAIDAYLGGMRNLLSRWRERLLGVLAEIEAGIEFPEDDDIASSDNRASSVRHGLEEMVGELDRELSGRRQIRKAETGLVIPLVGPKNAGKSSLFNILVGGDRSIVHHTPGTTRDFVSERLRIAGTEVTIIDTAGVGDSTDEVELLGIRRTWDLVRSGDLVVWVTDPSQPISSEEERITAERNGAPMIGIVSKTDLVPAVGRLRDLQQRGIASCSGSLVTVASAHDVIAFFERHVTAMALETTGRTVLLNQRQEALAEQVRDRLSEAAQGIAHGEEIASQRIKDALVCLDELGGRGVDEQVLDRIFERFCIGK
jgi:tRNA modification GTPase